MNAVSAYEAARAANIARNQALLAELELQKTPRGPTGRSVNRPTDATRRSSTSPHDPAPPPKRRRVLQPAAPTRSSARLAAAVNETPPSYNEDVLSKPPSASAVDRIGRTRSAARPAARRTARRPAPSRNRPSRAHPSKAGIQIGVPTETAVDDASATAFVPALDVEEIMSRWSQWTPNAERPSRDEDGTFRFADQPTFLPNKSPAEMMREGAFGGSYWRPLRSRRLGVVVEGDWEELPQEWIEGLDVETFLTSPEYNPEVNKYKVACGQSIEEWEASGWIDHEHDVRGWFQWYTRFYQGRRCDDDERQISRWRKCVGKAGRWRIMLLKKYAQAGVHTVWDDGEDEDAPQVSPVIHQTCHHWAFEVRQEALDAFWSEV